MPYKNGGRGVYYSGIIPFNGSKANIYDISGNTPFPPQIEYDPPYNFFLPLHENHTLKVPISVGTAIVSIVAILLIIYRRNN